MATEGGSPTASGDSEPVEGASPSEGGSGDSGAGSDSSICSASDPDTPTASSPAPVPEDTQTTAAKEQLTAALPSPEASPSAEVASATVTSSPTLHSSTAEASLTPGSSTESFTVLSCSASQPTPRLAFSEATSSTSPKDEHTSPKEHQGARPKEFLGARPKEYAGVRPKERSPVGSTPVSPRAPEGSTQYSMVSSGSSASMLAQQGSVRSPSEVSLSPPGGDGVETLRRYSGSTEDEGERERHHGNHWHLPFRKKLTIVGAPTSPPKSVSFLDEAEFAMSSGHEHGEGHHSPHKEHHCSSIGHAISHSSLGRAVSHSPFGHAVSHLFHKKGHHSPPRAEGGEKTGSPPGSGGAAQAGSPPSHHSIGHVVAEFFKKGAHHSPQESSARSGTLPVEHSEDVVSSVPSGPDETEAKLDTSASSDGVKAPTTSPTKGSHTHHHHHHEHHSIASMGHAVAKAFKKLNTSIVGSPGKPPRWKTWRRGGEADPKAHRFRRRSLPGRRLSESANAASYDVAVLPLLRRRRSASRSPDRRARSPPRDRDAALQRLRRQALRRHQTPRHRAVDFLHFRRWRRSCPDLSTATPAELERTHPPIRHVVMRRALVDERERIVLLYPGDKLKKHFQLFEWALVNQEDESQIYIKFFKFHKCYDLIPTSAKLVVFDTQLLVKKAFFALVYNGVRAAPLWDSKKQQYVGMLTITDFIRILQMYYRNSDERIEELEEHKLETWRTVLESDSKPLIYIEPEASLFDAITMLLENRIHRLPVIDPVSGDVLYIITHKRILRFLCLYLHNLPRPSFLSRTLGELRIGTYDRIETARPDTPVIEALTKFVNRRVSALPIVDADNKLTHIYAKFDVINLAAEKTYNNLNVPLMTANSHRSENKVEACRLSDTLSQVLEKIVHAEVHRLVITDDDQHVIGIISLSDILDALVIRPHEYNTLPDSAAGSESAGDDERHMIVEEEPGDEEDPVAAAAGIGRLNLDTDHKDG